MNWLSNLGLQTGVALNGYNAMQKNTLANQILQQQATQGQNAIDAATLAGLILPGMANGMGAQGPSPMLPAQSQPQLPTGVTPFIPQNANPSADLAILDLFGGNSNQPAPAATPNFEAAMNGTPAPSPTPPQSYAAPAPVSVPGTERYPQLAQMLTGPQAANFSPAARFGAAQQIMGMMNPQDRLANQLVLQEMRNQMAMGRMASMEGMNAARIQGMLGATGMRNDTAMRGQDMREPGVLDALKFDADNAARNHRALVQLYGYNQTPDVAQQVEAARQEAAQKMDAYMTAVRNQGTTLAPSSTPAPTTQGKYTVGQEINLNGKRYRVTGGDMNDPDIEEIK
jgi:hypothetical protein